MVLALITGIFSIVFCSRKRSKKANKKQEEEDKEEKSLTELTNSPENNVPNRKRETKNTNEMYESVNYFEVNLF